MTAGTIRLGAVALGWLMAASIVVLSLGPPPDTGLDLPNQDKWGHLIAYGALMAWFGLLYPRWPSRLGYLAGFSLMGAGLELIQAQMPLREGSAADIAANLAGLLLGLALGWLLARRGIGF